MRATGAAIAIAILLGLGGFPAQDAEARVPDNRHAKPATRAAVPAAATRTAIATRNRSANATQRSANQRRGTVASRNVTASRNSSARRGGGRFSVGRASAGISCVPYARQATGMAISGNGGQWWHNAAGLYARDNRPEVGAIMAFRSSGGMRSGHVAVVERVISSREVLIHHANWGGPGIRRGSIMRGVSVVDASPNNDWTQVRVQVGHSNENYGRTYPTFGFIHNRPDATGGAMFAGTPLRGGAAQAASLALEEVAEAPPARRARR